MNYESVMLVLMLIKEGVGVAKEIAALAERVLNGEEITKEEIAAAKMEVSDAIADWKKVAGNED